MNSRFQTPVIWYPNKELGEIQQQIENAFFRAYVTEEWEQGRLETDTFLDVLDSHKIDVYDLVSVWEAGLIL